MNLAQKTQAYHQLILQRKNHHFKHTELTNPSQTAFDINEIEPWAQWQNNLNAKILLVGQEFCDVATYKKTLGRVEQYPEIYEYPSNQNLADYFNLLGYNIGHPLNPNKNMPLFFTNAVMGLKQPPMSSNFKDKWLEESRDFFLKPLIELIAPKIIITIGTKAAKSVGKLYNLNISSLKTNIDNLPLRTENDTLIFTLYHVGRLGLINRPKDLQIKDWENIKNYLF